MFTNFTRALERRRETGTLDYHQFWRYTMAGRLPKILYWLVENQDLAEALAADAAALRQAQAKAKANHATASLSAN